ncbi:MAG: TCP-1/cpn60 chaperonin family protein [Halobacteriaceae archaeon]
MANEATGDQTAAADVTGGAAAVCDLVRSTLGPFGANKLLVTEGGNVVTTSSGSELVDQLDVEHPTVSLVETAASGFHGTHADGAGRVVTLAGALLDEAESLAAQGLHPTTIERGYDAALEVARNEVDAAARPLSEAGADAVARTALTDTRDPGVRDRVGAFLVDVAAELPEAPSGVFYDRKQVKIQSRYGGTQSETELVRGIVLDHEPLHEGMPRDVSGGVAVVSDTVDLPRFFEGTGDEGEHREKSVSMTLDSFEDRDALSKKERETFESAVRDAVDAGCRVVVTSRGINDRVHTILSNHGILAVHQIDEEDVARIARATGTQVVPGFGQVTADTLGSGDAGVRRVSGRDMTVVESDAGEPVYTLFVRAPDPRTVEAFERSVRGALADVLSARHTDTVVPGGGAVEVRAARAVRAHARTISGAEQLAAEAFADALLVVPRALSANAGIDAWDGVIDLLVAHEAGRDATCVDCLAGTTADAFEEGIVEPTALVRDVLAASTDLATQILRIDEQVPARKLSPEIEAKERGPPNPDNRRGPTPEHLKGFRESYGS